VYFCARYPSLFTVLAIMDYVYSVLDYHEVSVSALCSSRYVSRLLSSRPADVGKLPTINFLHCAVTSRLQHLISPTRSISLRSKPRHNNILSALPPQITREARWVRLVRRGKPISLAILLLPHFEHFSKAAFGKGIEFRIQSVQRENCGFLSVTAFPKEFKEPTALGPLRGSPDLRGASP
jgi:hypothetical protein